MLVCGARSPVHHHHGRTMIFEEFNRFMPCLCTNWRMSIFNDANSTGYSEPDDSSKTRTYSCLRILGMFSSKIRVISFAWARHTPHAERELASVSGEDREFRFHPATRIGHCWRRARDNPSPLGRVPCGVALKEADNTPKFPHQLQGPVV